MAVVKSEKTVTLRTKFLQIFLTEVVNVPYISDDPILESFLTVPFGKDFDTVKKVRPRARAEYPEARA